MLDIPFTHEQIVIGTAVSFGLFLLVVVFLAIRTRGKAYEAVTSILTPSEQRFYKALRYALQDRAVIMAKVRIADILKVRKTIARKHFWRFFSQISQKHIDFVLLDPKDFTMLCVIELDDTSHIRPDRIQRDRFVNQIMKQADIPLHRFAVQRRYDLSQFLKLLNV